MSGPRTPDELLAGWAAWLNEMAAHLPHLPTDHPPIRWACMKTEPDQQEDQQ